MKECQDIHQRLTGRRLRGWFSPAITNTLRHLRSRRRMRLRLHGRSVSRRPAIPVRTRSGRLLSIPYSVDLNDVIVQPPRRGGGGFRPQIRDTFDTLYDEGAEQGRVMCVALHPYWVGQPHRIRAFRRAMEYVLSHPGVWLTTGAEIIDWYNAHHLPADRGAYRGAGSGQWLSGHRRSARCARPGMDHAHYPFRRLPDAPRFAWPDGARIAFTVTLVLDYWEVDPPPDRQPRPAHRLPARQFLSRLAHLEPARIRRACRHLPRARRARSVRRDAQRRLGRGGGEAVSGVGGRTAAPRRLLHGARHLRDATHHVEHGGGGGTRADRRGARGHRRRDGRDPARVVRAGFRRIRAHPGAAGRGWVRLHH